MVPVVFFVFFFGWFDFAVFCVFMEIDRFWAKVAVLRWWQLRMRVMRVGCVLVFFAWFGVLCVDAGWGLAWRGRVNDELMCVWFRF